MNWKECSNNPVVDQGGTWIYDRAGWCPGTFGDTYDHDITPHVQGGTISIDYGMEVTTGGMEGNYRTTVQLVSYGDYNFSLDGSIEDIIAPTNWEYHNRVNPICGQPIITFKNVGEDTITTAEFVYRVKGGLDVNYTWNGSLAFNESDTVFLTPVDDWFWSSGSGEKVFEVELVSVNQTTDENPDNNIYYSEFEAPDVLPSDVDGGFYFWVVTNGAGSESEYYLTDIYGDTLGSRTGMANYTTYRDTFLLAPGCYTFKFIDSDEDGLSFFANNDGNGYLRWKPVNGGTIYNFENNFGDELIYNFTVGGTLNIEEESLPYVSVYPNPTEDLVNFELEGVFGPVQIELISLSGATVRTKTVNSSNGGLRTFMDVYDLPSGVYLVKIHDEKSTVVKRFVKR